MTGARGRPAAAPARRTGRGLAARALALVAATATALILAGATTAAQAASERWQALAPAMFEHLTPERGLPHPLVMSVVQDGDGFLWFGTQHGLARWDGYRMRTFLADAADPTSLPGNFIQTLHVDRQGRLWIGTTTAGVAMYDKQRERFVRYGAGPRGLSGASINAIASDRRGGIWAGGVAGLDYIDTVRGTVTHQRQDGPRRDQIRALLLDRAGNLWLGSNGGLARRDAASGRFAPVPVSDAGAAGAWDDAVLALAAGASGEIAFGTLKSGVGVVAPGASGAHILALPQVRDAGGTMVLSVAETAPGRWWAGTYGGGVIEFEDNGHGRRITHRPAVATSLASDRVAALWRDRSGLVWVANERGVDTYNPANRTIDTVFDGEGLPEVSVLSFMSDAGGRLWVALGDHGVDLIAPDGGRTAALRPDPAHPETALPNRLILSMAEAEPGEAWIGTQLGLYHTSGHGSRVARVPLPQGEPLPRVSTILRQDGVLWLGTMNGLLRYDPRAATVRAYGQGAAASGGLSDSRINAVAAAPDGALWIGTRNGLNRLDPASGKVEQLLANPANPAALPEAVIGALLFDARGRLWVGSNGGGISILERRAADGSAVFRHLGTADGLPDTMVSAMMADRAGRIWVASINGIAAVDSATLRARAYRRADGLVFLPYFVGATAQTPDGDILFGSSGGYTVVHPGQPQAGWDYAPPLAVSSVRLGARAVPVAPLLAAGGPGLTVPPATSKFEVEVAALDFSASASNRYAFWLEGYDKDWVEMDAGRRVAAYRDLAPGQYRLRMRGSNRDGAWSPHELAMDIEVLPAWYQTWWAHVGFLLAAIALASALYRWRVRQLRQTQAMLQALVYSRTRHLEKVHAVVKSINEQLDFDVLLHTILLETSAISGVDAAHALIAGDDEPRLAVRASWQRDGSAPAREGMTPAEAEQRYVRRAHVIAPDIFLTPPDGSGAGARLAVRISVGRQVRGYLVFDSGRRDAPFAPGDLDLFKALKEPFVSAFQKAAAIRAIEQARTDAEASTRAKSDFLANISHEIRTPMNAILGFAGLGSHLDLPTQPLDYFRKIGRAGQSLLGIINDVLDFSKIESGKLELEAVPFDLPDTLSQIADLFSWRAAEKGLELLVSAAPDVPAKLIGDPLRLSQVLINLVGNALKFTARGYISLRVELADGAADDAAADAGRAGRQVRLRFSVEDTGVGISAEQQTRLFQAFSQADASTTRLYGGTGLGLAISQRLVHAMGGVIGFDSTPDAGSRFAFTIALRVSAVAPAALLQAPAGARGKKVLIVDDSAPTREVLELQLRSFGFEPRAVASGAAALQVLQAQPYELVLMDWNMPDMDGIEAARRIKSDPRLAVIPTIIMVTAFAREHIKIAAEQAGIDAFLAKPVHAAHLLMAVLRAFGLEVDALPEPAAAKAAPSPAALGIRGARVLVVDDNAINRQVAGEILQRVGVHVELAATGVEALRMVALASYDAVLMDIQMPEMDGYEATARIREKSRHALLPIIAMTAHAVAGFRESCLAMGMNDYVTKPIEPDTLFGVLANWIAPDPARAAATVPPAADGAAALRVPGIDMDAALARLGGNGALLTRLLGLFIDEFAPSLGLIEAAIEDGDFERAAALAHKVRGAAANLSIDGVSRAAGELEELLLSGGQRPPGAALAAFAAALAAVIDGAQAKAA